MIESPPTFSDSLMVALAGERLGTGLYTVAEAAMYARVSPAKFGRWLFGNPKGKAVVDPQYAGGGRDVGFLDLIQMLAIRELRIQKKVPLPKFRQAIETAKKQGLDYPFARLHTTYLYGDELVIRLPGDEFVEASGKHRGQRCFKFIELYLKDLDFTANGLANQFRIFRSDHPQPVQVVMNPERRFGEPLLPSGYTALTIWEAIRTEGGIEPVVEQYRLSRWEVEAAYQFVVNHLGTAAT